MKSIEFYPSHSPENGISVRTLEVLSKAAEGCFAKEIAASLNRSEPTIRSHQLTALNHYDARNTAHAVAQAIALGDIKFRIGPVKPASERIRATAIAMIFAALVTTAVDTPFVSDVDQTLVRHHTTRTTRTARSMRLRGRRDQLDLVIG